MREKGDIVKSGMFVVLGGMLAAHVVSAQTVPPPPAPAPVPAAVPAPVDTQTPLPARPAESPATTPAPAESAPLHQAMPVPQVPSAQQAAPGRRHTIKMMEAVLQQAARGGAEQLAEQLGRGNPNVSFFTGQARARGIVLDGYGVFFQVEIPEMQSSLVMSLTTLERDVAVADTLDSMRRAISAVPDGVGKLQMEQALKRLQMQVGPAPQQPEVGMIRATETAASDPIPPVELPFLRDPTTAYREAIKSALIDAMLDHSRGLNIQPDEWLTVAAQRGDSPLGPTEINTSSTLVLRIRGRDLALYEADRTRKDAIRNRVEVREF